MKRMTGVKRDTATQTGAEGQSRQGRQRRSRPRRLSGQPGNHVLLREHGSAPRSQRVYQSSGAGGIQAKGGIPAHDTGRVRFAAARGTAGPGRELPHKDRIQRAFGNHDIGDLKAHTGPQATDACRELGAAAYTQGHNVVFGHDPSLSTASHEAAHVVQQRSGISLPGGAGRAGDAYERHAEAVARAVVSGGDAEALLSQLGGGSLHGDGAVQQSASEPVQMEPVSAVAIASLVIGIVGTLIGAGSAAYTVSQAKNDEVTGGVEETLDFSGRFFLTSLHEAYLKAMGEALIRKNLDDLDPGWDTRGETDYLQQAKTATEIEMAETMTRLTHMLVMGFYGWGGDDSRAGGEIQPGGSLALTTRGVAGWATVAIHGGELTAGAFPGLEAAASRHGFDVSNSVPYLERVVLSGDGRTGEGIVENDQIYVRPGTFSAGRRGTEVSVTGQFYFDWDDNTTRMVWGDANAITHNSVPEPSHEDGPPNT